MTAMLDTYRPRGVRDVAADKFIAAYAAHLKAGDKVCFWHWKNATAERPFKQQPGIRLMQSCKCLIIGSSDCSLSSQPGWIW